MRRKEKDAGEGRCYIQGLEGQKFGKVSTLSLGSGIEEEEDGKDQHQILG